MYRIHIMIFMIAFAIALSACSNSSGPIAPSGSNTRINIPNTLPVGVTDVFSNGQPAGGYGALGLFNLNLDKAGKKAELTPLRQTSLTDVLEIIDITNFLKLSPCTDCAAIDSLSLDEDNNLVVKIGIRHPFEANDPYSPPGPMFRDDLHVFNVEGIVVSNLPGETFGNFGVTVADFELINRDGYSEYLDPVLDDIYPTDATIHPYVMHFDDYSQGNFDPSNPMGFENVNMPPPSGNLVMAMGCDYDYKDYVFEIGNDPMDFIFAIGCTYGVSAAGKSARLSPEYRVPQHNKKAASEVWIEIGENNLESDDTSSSAEILINVVDISHGVTVGTALDEMLSDSSVDKIVVNVPMVLLEPVEVDGTSATSGSGHEPSDPLVYSAIVTNSANAEEGTYNGIVKVIDSYLPGQNISDLLDGNDGIKRVEPLETPLTGLFEISEFATYQTFTIEVIEGGDFIYVDNSFLGPYSDGTRSNPYVTIQEGIDAAPEGYTVKVDDSGTPYGEEVHMRSYVTVLSSNWDETDGTNRAYIDGPDTENTKSVVFDNVSNAVLSGFRIGYCGLIDMGWMDMIYIEGGTGNTVRDCLFTGLTEMYAICCIDILNSENCIIEYNEISDIDSEAAGLELFWGAYAESCPGIIIRNNRVTNIRNTMDSASKIIDIFTIKNTDNATYTNNLIYKLIPLSMGMGAHLYKGLLAEGCSNFVARNNTGDEIDVSDGFMVQQIMVYWFDTCTDVTFSNNIGSRIDAVNFPAVMGRGVQAVYGDVVCDYCCMWDVPSPYHSCPAGDAIEGEGCTTEDPEYLDPLNGNFEIGGSVQAQLGDPSFLDWDDDDSGGIHSRSRMGCTGGPGGEIVGLLTP